MWSRRGLTRTESIEEAWMETVDEDESALAGDEESLRECQETRMTRGRR